MKQFKMFQQVLGILSVVLSMPVWATEKSAYNLDVNYAQTVWSAGHRDAANTDYVPVLMSKQNKIAKHLLQGYPIFWAPTTGPQGNYYVTSGKGKGSSNLHALDAQGNVLWKSKPQQSLDDLDGWAIINAPVVAANGDIYVGDQNQLWAYKPDGRVKWLVELTQYGVDYGFMSVVISRQGYIGGISSNGKVIFFDADSGKLAMPVLDLPGGDGPQAKDKPTADLWKGLMEPELKAIMFNLIQGWEMEVANTPALHPQTGRVYITAYGVEPGTGLLYGIDVFDDHLAIAFQAEMGQGSGTSPAISQNGQQVYALDEAGHMIAIDAVSGKHLWTSDKKGGGAASPSVGPDESIYTLFQGHLIGFHYDGSLKFEHYYNDFCAERIEKPGWFAGLFLSQPVAFLDSLFTVDADNTGWMNVICGYHIKLLASNTERTLVPIPNRSFIVSVNLDNGVVNSEPLRIPETSEGFILPMANGNLLVTLSGAISSIFYHSLNALLPQYLEVPFEPKAGLLMLQPLSRSHLLRQSVAWLQRRLDQLALDLNNNKTELLVQQLKNCRLQVDTSVEILKKLGDEGGVSSSQFEAVNQQLLIIQTIFAAVESSGSLGQQQLDEIQKSLTAVQATMASGV